MLFTLVTPFMALLAAVQANVVTVHDSVTITEDLTETVTITNCGTKSCHPASYITYTSGSQEIVSCPTGGVPTSHGYSAPTVASEPVSETSTSTSTEYTRTRTHTRHHSRHSHSSSASAESVSSAPGFSATVTSAPCSSEETSVASHHPHVVSSSVEHSSNSASAPGSSAPCSSAPGSSRATAVASHSSHIAKSSAVNPGPSTSSHVVSSSAPGSSGASSDASPTSYVTSSSAVSSTFSAPASPSYVAPAHNTTSAEACITCHSSVPSDRSISVSTTTLCASAGCSPQNSTSRASYIASTGVSSGSYNTSSSGVKSASTSALYTTRSAEASSILPAASYNASSAIVSNGTSLASCTSCTVEVTPIPSVPQGTLSSESNQEVTAYVDVTATRYLNSSSAVLHSYVSSDIATRSLSQSIYSDRSNSSVSSIPSVSSYQGGASSMRAAGFGAVLGAALIAIM